MVGGVGHDLRGRAGSRPTSSTRVAGSDRGRIDGQVSATADHDRAVLGFYLGGALMNQRAYELAAETQLDAARRLEVIEPTSLLRLWTGAGAAMSFTMLGHLDEASAAIDEVSGLAGWTDWSADWYFAAPCCAHRTDRRGARRCERSEHASTTRARRRWSAQWLQGLACWPASRAVTDEPRSSSTCSPLREPPHRRRSCTKPSVTSRGGATRSSRTDGSSGFSGSSSDTGRWNGRAFFAALGVRLHEELGGLEPAPHAG